MKSLRLFLEDADRDAALEKLKSKRAKAAEKSQKTRDEFYKSAEENKRKSESDIDSLVKHGESELQTSLARKKKEKERLASLRAQRSNG